MESHLAYPVLAFFRSSHEDQSWVGTLGTLLDAATLVDDHASTARTRPSAHLLQRRPARGERSLALLPRRRRSTRAAGIERAEFDHACDRLAAAGYALRDRDDAWTRFALAAFRVTPGTSTRSRASSRFRRCSGSAIARRSRDAARSRTRRASKAVTRIVLVQKASSLRRSAARSRCCARRRSATPRCRRSRRCRRRTPAPPLSPGTIGSVTSSASLRNRREAPAFERRRQARDRRRRNRREPDSRAARPRGRSRREMRDEPERRDGKFGARVRTQRDVEIRVLRRPRAPALLRVADRHVQVPRAVDRVLHRKNVAAPRAARDHEAGRVRVVVAILLVFRRHAHREQHDRRTQAPHRSRRTDRRAFARTADSAEASAAARRTAKNAGVIVALRDALGEPRAQLLEARAGRALTQDRAGFVRRLAG